jgi:acetoin utilization deacetylase AcuC-like enzyme
VDLLRGSDGAVRVVASIPVLSRHRRGVGEGERREGHGFTLNIPLDAGAKEDEIERKYAAQVIPAVRNFKPDLLLISAGF